MKPYTTLLILLGLLWSCAPTLQLPTKIEQETGLGILDFRSYTEKGFLITPETYKTGEYESVGMIDYWVEEGATWTVEETKVGKYAGGDLVDRVRYWKYEGVDLQKMLDIVYSQCKKMGADALINFKLTRGIETKGPEERRAYVRSWRIQGLAINRN